MIYIDTDVLVNFFIVQKQAPHLHPIAIKVIEQVTNQGLFFISVHSLNELGFALAKCVRIATQYQLCVKPIHG